MNSGPESAAIYNLDRKKRGDHIKETADLLLPLHPRIAAIMEKIAIKPEAFADLYGQESLDRDAAYVARRKAQFALEANKMGPNGLTHGETRNVAEILEYQVLRGINVGRWIPFGIAFKTADKDDIGGGIDLGLELQKDQQFSHLGLGIDISFSHNLQDKYLRIKQDIDTFGTVTYDEFGRPHKNQLGVIKYYISPNSGFRGELSCIPRAVVALDLGVLEDLSRTKNTEIAGHMAKHAIILEIEHQLAVYADYARRTNPACLDHIMRAQNFVHMMAIATDSKEKLKRSEYHKNDKIEEAQERGLDLFR